MSLYKVSAILVRNTDSREMSGNSHRKLAWPGQKKGNESDSQPVVERVRPQTAIPRA